MNIIEAVIKLTIHGSNIKIIKINIIEDIIEIVIIIIIISSNIYIIDVVIIIIELSIIGIMIRM
jgi:hypothetical protein